MLKFYQLVIQRLLPRPKANFVIRIGMHSRIENVKLSSMEVSILPALVDNYMYLLVDNVTKQAVAIDPVEPEKILEIVERDSLKLTKILTTHHHWDHASGNEKLLMLWKQPIEVYGADHRIPALTNEVKDDSLFQIGELTVRCLLTPCHTSGHVCYYIFAKHGEGVVFTGDTLFQGGCGRFFEGTPKQMYCALCQKLAALPDETKIFCGHEYTIQNLAYAAFVDSRNMLIKERLEWAKQRRLVGETTIPSTIGQEKQWNPFMRVNEQNIQRYTGNIDPISTMQALRKEKDTFKP